MFKAHGRKEGINQIFIVIKNYIENAKNTNGKTFHYTLTYFWSHMLYLASTIYQVDSFDQLLYKCPWLLNGMLVLEFWDKDVIFKSKEARELFWPPNTYSLPDCVDF